MQEGNLVIATQADAEKYKDVTEVTGDLSLSSSAKLDAPKLESVGGYLSINSSAKLDALKSVGGDLYIYSSAKLDAPKLYAGGFDKFKVQDGIPCVMLSSKTVAGVMVHSCRQAKIKNRKIIGEKMYVAEKSGTFAHGKTVREAVDELAFKTGDRDVSQYKGMPLTTSKTVAEWCFAYRIVTGACKLGVEDFLSRQGKLKKKYTLKEVLAITSKAYAGDRFRKVVSQ